MYDIARIAREKAAQGLTNAALAQLAGLHPSTIKNVLAGQTAKPPTVKKVAEALGLHLPDLVVPADPVEFTRAALRVPQRGPQGGRRAAAASPAGGSA